LVDRGTKMLMKALDIAEDAARELLLENGSVRKGIEAYQAKKA